MAVGRQGGLVAIHGRRPAALACDLPCIIEKKKLHNYHTQLLLYPRPWNFCCFICVSCSPYTLLQNDVFYIYICIFTTRFIVQMYTIAQAYLRCCGVVKTNRSHTGILLAVSV